MHVNTKAHQARKHIKHVSTQASKHANMQARQAHDLADSSTSVLFGRTLWF